MKFSLYQWQEACLESWFSNNCRGIANVVTGAGKTILALTAIQRFKQQVPGILRVKIVVPTTFLLLQWRSSILEFNNPSDVSRNDIGLYYGPRKDSNDRDYMIYVINSARYSLARHIVQDLEQGFQVLLIADECHHYASGENKKIFDFMPLLKKLPGNYHCLGLSATPYCSQYEKVLAPALGGEVYRYGFHEAAGSHIVTPFVVFQIALSFNEEEKAAYEDLSLSISLRLRRLSCKQPTLKNRNTNDFFGRLNQLAHDPNQNIANLASQILHLSHRRKALVWGANSRLSCAGQLVASLSSTAKIILFGERISQADQVYELLSQQFPGQVGRCHSKMEKQARNHSLERFRDGELRILVSCRALDEGFDIPNADVGIILSCTSIERQRIQRLGRILRRKKEKEVASLYYFYLEASSESPSLFPQRSDSTLSFYLSYDASSNAFSFPEYESIAVQVLQRIGKLYRTEAFRKEAIRHLLSGMLRPDWLLGELQGDDIWEKKLQDATTTDEKNYWICMRQLGNLISR